MIPSHEIEIHLSHIAPGLTLTIVPIRYGAGLTLFDGGDEARENNEARYQLVEGCAYEYEFNHPEYSFCTHAGEVVQPGVRRKHTGRIVPNIYVGTLELPIVCRNNPAGSVRLEVQSAKTGYRSDYREMLSFIAEKCIDLIFRVNTPVYQAFDIDHDADAGTLYQKFAFLQAVLTREEFSESIAKILNAPVTAWIETSEIRDIRNAGRFGKREIRQLASNPRRMALREDAELFTAGLRSVPEKITVQRNVDSADTPENRFIKHVLETFVRFCSEISDAAPDHSRLEKESRQLIAQLEGYLQHGLFKEVSAPDSLKLNSPVLQRKEGYREVLRTWLMFELAAKLTWRGGEDVYEAGKKDIATLYEYWVFFKLLELFETMFRLESEGLGQLIQHSESRLEINLRSGTTTRINGVYAAGSRSLNVAFCYNKSFAGNTSYPGSGSWTTTMRPDYTLSFWPMGITEQEAETQELIVHIHFDAKYKVDRYMDFFRQSELAVDDGGNGNEGDTPEAEQDSLRSEKINQRSGNYKNADLLKMHAYKDAIRRTGGAYILYPGEQTSQLKGFHEIIPGLGAFSLKPSGNDSDIATLKSFLEDLLSHFKNRISQREKMALRTYHTYTSQRIPVIETLPEAYGDNRYFIPDEIHVLVGYCKSAIHFDWITEKHKYNIRIGSNLDEYTLNAIPAEIIASSYILLHNGSQCTGNGLRKVRGSKPKIFSRTELVESGYQNPGHNYYLVFDLEEDADSMIPVEVDVDRLFMDHANPTIYHPFAVTLADLLRYKR